MPTFDNMKIKRRGKKRPETKETNWKEGRAN